ncbi:MAG: glycosyltransferase family 2 protein [Saprospiraceae bacterium]|nr:glycosyltransferase family 2 protein [Saprospiraceae bacterium]
MFSVLIPVYNELIKPLVERLQEQLEQTGQVYQIIVLDDLSDDHYRQQNVTVSEIMQVSYIELSENVGRSKIRNRLAKLARYDHLIFLDCDVSLIDGQFIKNYQENIELDCVCGGIKYQSQAPSPAYSLHWKVGKNKEEIKASKRAASKSPLFFSSNFMIKAAIFANNIFDENICGYGYEDAEFARRLQEKDVKITHIDNPVQHDGLKENEVFIQDTAKAIENLAILYQAEKIKNTSLIKAYERIKSLLFGSTFISYLTESQGYFALKIKESNPSLWAFDVWKLSLFCSKIKEKS